MKLTNIKKSLFKNSDYFEDFKKKFSEYMIVDGETETTFDLDTRNEDLDIKVKHYDGETYDIIYIPSHEAFVIVKNNEVIVLKEMYELFESPEITDSLLIATGHESVTVYNFATGEIVTTQTH